MIPIEEQMQLFYNNRVVNWHEHVWMNAQGELDIPQMEDLILSAEKTGMDTLLCSLPLTQYRYCSPEQVRKANDLVFQAMQMHPDKIMGMCFIDPGNIREALHEIDRCVNDYGMVGVKMYHQYFINDPVQYPVIEKCIDLNIPILMHAGKATRPPVEQPHLSGGTHFADVAQRYPEANFIMAHIGGGGDWYWQLKAIAPYKNIVTDMSGSVHDRDIMEQTVAYLGADRVLFGTDGSTGMCVGKILACDIPVEDKKTILEGTAYLKFLERGKKTC